MGSVLRNGGGGDQRQRAKAPGPLLRQAVYLAFLRGIPKRWRRSHKLLRLMPNF